MLLSSTKSNKRQCITHNKPCSSKIKISYTPVSEFDVNPVYDIFNPNTSVSLTVISGPTGSGKTHMIHTIANQAKFDVHIFDPSSDENIVNDIRQLAEVKRFFTKNTKNMKVVLIDDIDGMTTKQCRNIIDYFKNTYNKQTCCSIIITYTEKLQHFSELLTLCNTHVKISRPTPKQIQKFGARVTSIPLSCVMKCSYECNGDIRQFITMIRLLRLNIDNTEEISTVDKYMSMHDIVSRLFEQPYANNSDVISMNKTRSTHNYFMEHII